MESNSLWSRCRTLAEMPMSPVEVLRPGILVCDDMESVREIFHTFFDHHGFKIRTAKNEVEAVAETYLIERPTVVFMDVHFGKRYNGIEVLRRIENTSRYPVVSWFMSADAEPDSELQCLDSGLALDYLAKYRIMRQMELARVRVEKSAQRLFWLIQTATRDNLTDLYTRRYFTELTLRELERVDRSNTELAILFIDFNDFKDINDDYGHDVGDQVLVEASRIIKEEMRHSDIAGRFGGDEFVVTLPESQDLNIPKFVRSLASRIAGHVIDTPKGPISFSVSVGVASTRDLLPEDKHRGIVTFEAMVKQADAHMYVVKSERRTKSRE